MNKDNLFVYSAIVIALIGLGLSTHQQATILLFAALPILVKMRNFGSKFTFDNVFILLAKWAKKCTNIYKFLPEN